MKKILIPFFVFILFLGVCGPTYAQFSQRLIPTPSIDYTLPFYGLAPDNPFYFLKALRDRIVLATTRDYVKKSEYLLLFSDKKIGMASKLASDGKYNEALFIASEAEDNFLSSLERLEQSKKYGGYPPGEVERRGRSFLKHGELIQEIKKVIPQDIMPKLEKINEVRKKASEKIDLLKEEKEKSNK